MTITDPAPPKAADPTPVEAQPASPTPARIGLNTDTMAFGAFFIAIFAMLAALVAVGLAARSIDEHRAVGATAAAGGSADDATSVSLAEFSISPDPIEVAVGGTLSVTNEGSVVHNLSVEGNATPMLDSGGRATLDLSALEPGSYTVFCDVSGHAAAGMEATLTVE